jgi:hypothetical protein
MPWVAWEAVFAITRSELDALATKALSFSNQILVEKSLERLERS